MSTVSDDHYLSPYEEDDEEEVFVNVSEILKQIDDIRGQILRGFPGYPHSYDILRGQELLFHVHSLERFVLALAGEQSLKT
jgi:hypothetical protein